MVARTIPSASVRTALEGRRRVILEASFETHEAYMDAVAGSIAGMLTRLCLCAEEEKNRYGHEFHFAWKRNGIRIESLIQCDYELCDIFFQHNIHVVGEDECENRVIAHRSLVVMMEPRYGKILGDVRNETARWEYAFSCCGAFSEAAFANYFETCHAKMGLLTASVRPLMREERDPVSCRM